MNDTFSAPENGYSVGEGMEITLHFSVSLEDGQVVDTTHGKNPATFTLGDGNLPPGFEAPMKGLAEGDKASYQIAPEHGFGQHNPQNIQRLPRDSFDDELEEGTVMSFSEPSGSELPGVISHIDEKFVDVDFNHPLAGRTLTFAVEIISIRPATTH